MGNLLYTIALVLIALWVLGFLLHIAGPLIHLVLVIAGAIFIYQLVTGRRRI